MRCRDDRIITPLMAYRVVLWRVRVGQNETVALDKSRAVVLLTFSFCSEDYWQQEPQGIAVEMFK